MKTVAFLSHHKSLARLKPDIKALRHLGFHTITLCNNKDSRPDFIHENEFFEVDLGDTIAIVNILSRFNIVFLSTPSDHLLTIVVNICTDTPLGNIETGFKLFDKPMECISPNCVSSADSKLPKKMIWK